MEYYRAMVRRRKEVIIIAGAYKTPAIGAALKGQLSNVWITYGSTARDSVARIRLLKVVARLFLALRIDECRSFFRCLFTEAREDVMSSDSIHVIITVGIIVLMFSWIPFVNVICPPGWRSTESSSKKKTEKR